MSEPIHILSEGAGIQSSTIDLMADRGLITPRPVARIFADTMGEPKAVYAWIQQLKSLSSLPFIEVCKGSLADDSLKIATSKKTGKTYLKGLIPAFTLNPDGSKGLMGRKCTQDYKIAMIIREVRKIIGKEAFKAWRKKHKSALRQIAHFEECVRAYKQAKKEKRQFLLTTFPQKPHAAFSECQNDPLCVMWIGISTDEADRMKPSVEPWIKTRWPLIELRMSREDCKRWMLANGYPEPPRSACTYCPFHSDDEWIRLRDESPKEFDDVVEYEAKLQEAARNQQALKGIPFLHDSCVPIREVVFKPTRPGYGQLSMFSNECEGMCGV